MGEIAREAGVSKGTLYVYFKSKEELFEAIVEAQCRQQGEQIFTLDGDGRHRNASCSASASSFARFLSPAGRRLRPAHRHRDRRPDAGARREVLPVGPRDGIASLKAYLEDKVAAGVLEPHDCEVAAAQFIDACVSTTFKPMLFNFAGPPDDARIAHVVDMAVRAFLAAYRAG